MKVAIQMSGQPRFCEDTDKFIERLKGYTQVDWFFYLWTENTVKLDNGSVAVSTSWLTLDQQTAIAKIQENLPVNHKVAALDLIEKPQFPKLRTQIESCEGNNLTKMFYGNYQVNLLRTEYEKIHGAYDLVIKSRPDLALESDCDLSEAMNFINSSANSIVTPCNRIHGYGDFKMNDMMAIGLPETITTYSNIIDQINNYPIPAHPETLLAYHCAMNNILIHLGNFEISLRTSHGHFVDGVHHFNFGRWQ